MNEKVLTIYTDGACRGNPGQGGWSAVLVDGLEFKIICGNELKTTNNRMELIAVIKAIKQWCKQDNIVNIFLDSKYVIDSYYRWKGKVWDKKKRTEFPNHDLWARLFQLSDCVRFEFAYIKGHNGNSLNEIADKIAVLMSKQKIF